MVSHVLKITPSFPPSWFDVARYVWHNENNFCLELPIQNTDYAAFGLVSSHIPICYYVKVVAAQFAPDDKVFV